MDVNRPVSYDLADYLGMLRRHWWDVVLLTVAGVAGGAAVARTKPKVYEAATAVLVPPTGVPGGNAAGGLTIGPNNLDTKPHLDVSTDNTTSEQKLQIA